MKATFLITLLSFNIVTLNAQSKSDIENIRTIYYKIKQDIDIIKKKKQKSRLDLYCNTLEKNVYKGLLGHYSKTEFWYNEEPYIKIETDENPRDCLEMITYSYNIANGQKYYKEYLFDKGLLVFAYSEYSNKETKKPQELRLYFKDNKLIKQLGKTGVQIGDEKNIIEESEFFMTQFLEKH